MLSNTQILERLGTAMKALTVGDLGSSVLTEEKADQFIREIENSTPVLNNARRLTMRSHTRDIDRIAFTSRIMTDPTTAEDDANDSEPTFTTNQLVAQEAMGALGLKDPTIEDNIERDRLEETVLTLAGRRVGVDLEELFLNGDTGSGDSYLALTDGWIKKAGNSVAGAPDFPTNGDFDESDVEAAFDAALQAIPKKYLRDRSAFRFLVTWDMEDDYRDVLKARNTDLGDAAQTGDGTLRYKGVALEFVPANSTARCIEERVITSARDADVGSILGWGFPAARGGTAGQIDTVGVTRFVARCDELAGRCGARFSPPDLLRRVAVNGGRFADARG